MPRIRIVSTFVVSFCLWTGCASTPVDRGAQNATETLAHGAPVRILSWSDFHSSIYETPTKDGAALGGLPVFMAAVEHIRGDGLSLLVDGGDMFQGAMPFNEAKGMGMIDVMNALHIDVATIGNHEFDYGAGATHPDDPRGALIEAIASSTFPWVNANIATTDPERYPWPPQNLSPYTIIEKGPYRIAVIGVVSIETPIATIASHVEGLEFRSAAESIRNILPEVLEQKPDFVIVDAHVDGTPDPLPEQGSTVINASIGSEMGEILALPENVLKHVDLLLTAHSHKSFIAYQGDVTVVQSLSAGREITEIPLVHDGTRLRVDRENIRKHYLLHAPVDSACGEPTIPLGEMAVGDLTLTPSAQGRDIVTKYESRMTTNRCEVVGCTDAEVVRNNDGECALGNLITDAMRAHYPQAQAAFQNAGGLRIDLPKGPIYREALNALMPFENYTYLVEMSGEAILKMLKISASMKHGLTQVSGINYAFEPNCRRPGDLNGDGTVEAWEYDCLCEQSVRIAGEPLDGQKRYTVALSDFMFKGGDSLGGIFDDAKVIDKGPLIKTLLLDYVKTLDACFSSQTLISTETPRISPQSCGVLPN